jgi:hypothetical protein
VQWVSILTGLVGAGWLLGAALLPRIGLPPFEIPTADLPVIEGWAVPTLLIVAAVLVGILLGLLAGALGALTGASRRRRARKRLVASIETVVDASVTAPLSARLDRARAFGAALRAAAS